MQLLFVLGIGVVMLSLMGTAVLANTGTNIDLLVQAIGFGEGDIVSPLTDGSVSIEILLDTIPPVNEEEDPITFVSACGFHSDEDILWGEGISDGLIICKLLNEDGNAIAEGEVPLTEPAQGNVVYSASDTLVIIINQPIFNGATHFDNFYDARIIVEAPL